MTYYALGNTVFTQDDKVALVVSPVWFRKHLADQFARYIAEAMNQTDMDSRDVMRGSLD